MMGYGRAELASGFGLLRVVARAANDLAALRAGEWQLLLATVGRVGGVVNPAAQRRQLLLQVH